MSAIDLDVLYLILTKVATKQDFYSYEISKLSPNQIPGTITYKHLSEVYQRITGKNAPWRFEWAVPLRLISDLLTKCKLPPLACVAVADLNHEGLAFRPGEGFWSFSGVPKIASTMTKEQIWMNCLKKSHETNWPAFKDLAKLFR